MTKQHLFSLMVILSSFITIMSMEDRENRHANQNTSSEEIPVKIKRFLYDNQNDKFAIIGEQSNFVQICDNSTKKIICTLQGHNAPITCLAWHPDSTKNLIVTGSEDTTVKLWDANLGKCLNTFKLTDECKYKSPITSIALCNDKENIALVGNAAGLAFLLKFSGQNISEQLEILSCEKELIYYVSFNTSGSLACIASDDKVQIYFKDLSDKWLNDHIIRYDLEPSKKVQSFKLNNRNILFIRIIDIETDASNCITLKINLDKTYYELDLNVFDYCEQTKKFLTARDENKIFEDSFEPSTKLMIDPFFVTSSPIKSASYYNDGTRIIVRTNTENNLLEKKDDKWELISTQPIPSESNFNSERNKIYASISQKTVEQKEDSSSQPASNNITENTLDNSEQPTSLKRKSSAENGKAKKSTKFRKTSTNVSSKGSTVIIDISNLSEEEDELDVLLIPEIDEEEGLRISETTDHDSEDSNDGISEVNSNIDEATKRYQRECKIISIMYDLIMVDENILNKSFFEVIANYPDNVVKDFYAYKQLDNKAAHLNLSNEEVKTGLFRATEQNKEATLKYLVEKGASVNMVDNQLRTPLHIAVQNRFMPLVSYLITRISSINTQNDEGETILHSAINNKDLDMVKIILASDPDLTIVDRQGCTPVHRAVQNECTLIVNRLLSHDSSTINKQNAEKDTALHIAIKNRDAEMTRILLGYNPDLRILNLKNQTPLILVIESKIPALIRLFREYEKNN